MKQSIKPLLKRGIQRLGYELHPQGTVAQLQKNPGYFSTTETPAQDVAALLRDLAPVTTAQPLIRLGPNGDGGYLLPDDLADLQACFSPGVSEVSGFEKACAEHGMQVFLADKSVDGPAEQDPNFHFSKKFIGSMNNADFMTLDSWVSQSISDTTTELLLQIDIEGAEYETFFSCSEPLLQRFRMIVAEFHLLDQLWNQPFFDLASRAFHKILQTHQCVHLHPNNCCGTLERQGLEIPKIMEFTFVRKDRLQHPRPQQQFPHPLDYDNTHHPTLTLPSCWHL